MKNGAASEEEMRARVARYRPGQQIGFDWPLGCRILVQPVLLPEIAWIPLPPSWSRNIVSFKTYRTEEAEGRALWDRLMAALEGWGGLAEATATGPGVSRYGEPALMRPRLGQGAFRISVLDAYERACAVSGGKVLPALEAAHIRPYAAGGAHEIANGILMRRDIHSVFDAGYVTVDPDLRFVLSDRVRTDFNNGEEYRRLHGARIATPDAAILRPSREALRWHNERCFLG